MPDRVIVVTDTARASQLLPLAETRGARFLIEPVQRGTATDIMLTTTWVTCREPEATVVIVREGRLLEGVVTGEVLRDVAAFVQQHPLWMVLLGVPATAARADCGWIEVGEWLARAGARPVLVVRQFLEQPRSFVARACFADGWLWNSFVLVAKASVLAETIRRTCPRIDAHWREAVQRAVIEDRLTLPGEAYVSAPTADFSRAVLERLPSGLAVVPLAVSTDDRAFLKTPRGVGIVPDWLLRPGYA